MSKCYLYGSGGGSAAVGSEIEVTAPTGSTVVCSLEGIVKTAREQNGIWLFRGCDVGTWTVTAVLGEESASETVEIREEDRRFRYRTELSYRTWPDSFDLAAYGTKGVNYQVVGADDAELLPADYRKDPGWKLRLLTGGTLIARKKAKVDVFCVGGGGGGGNAIVNYGGGGGGGGYTKTGRGITMTPGVAYSITVGAGGAKTASGGSTSAFGLIANGGSPGSTAANNQGGAGGAGGSGGGGGGWSNDIPGSNGGSNGSNGNGKETAPTSGSNTNAPGGTGQGTTTREFGESTGTLYCGGGGGGRGKRSDGTLGRNGSGGSGGGAAGGGAAASGNTGGGGGGGASSSGAGGAGGSGIVVIRNAKG